MYACLEDANIEISKTLSKKLGKFKYHKVSVQSEGSYKRKPGRPFVNTVETNENNSFKLEIVWGQDSECIETIIGPGRVKMTKPSLVAIYQIFYEIQTIVYHAGLTTQRDFSHPPNDSIKTVLRCLGIKESSFIRGSTS
ncbi:MAG: hypothetical protein ACYCYE_03645 [Clostridia bacterium]